MKPAERQINVPLLRKTLEHIEAHPEEWEQSYWFCGTSACFAGHAVLLADDKAERAVDNLWPQGNRSRFVRTRDGRRARVGLLAQEALGLNGAEADLLFYCENTLDDLRRIVADLCDGQ